MLLCILGKSNAGKTTFVNHLEKKYGIKRVVTSTSRPKRPNEVNGVDYHFYSYDTMRSDINKGEYLEWNEFNSWLYGTKISDIDIKETSLIVLNPEGYKRLKQLYKDEVLCIYIKPSILTRIKRILIRDRGNYKEAFRRMRSDYIDFKDVDADIIIKDFKLK